MSKDIKKPIILVGVGGAGKTSIGRVLADQQGLGFFDVDQLITEQEGRTIPTIFEQAGEAYFRQLELEITLNTIKSHPSSVISVGGGAFINDEIRSYIKKHCVSVFLEADIDTLLKRVGNGEGRPLLQGNPQEKLHVLIRERYPVYQQADFTIESKEEPLEETVSRVTDTLYNGGALS